MSATRRTDSTVASPCISVCEIDARSGLCSGCLRSLDEIAAWSTLDDAGKREVLEAVGERRSHLAMANSSNSRHASVG